MKSNNPMVLGYKQRKIVTKKENTCYESSCSQSEADFCCCIHSASIFKMCQCLLNVKYLMI